MVFGELEDGNVSRAGAGKSSRKRSSTASGRLALMGIPDRNSCRGWAEQQLLAGTKAKLWKTAGQRFQRFLGSRESRKSHSQLGWGVMQGTHLCHGTDCSQKVKPTLIHHPGFPAGPAGARCQLNQGRDWFSGCGVQNWAGYKSKAIATVRAWIVAFILFLGSLQSSFTPLDYLEKAFKVLLNKSLSSEKRRTFSEAGRCICARF